MDFADFKKFFIYNLIISLIICSLVAVISILIGKFPNTLGRVIFTLFMIVLHSLVALAFIWDNEKQGTFESLRFFINTIFFLIVLSFLVSIFGIWDLFDGTTVGSFYKFFLVIAFASLHGNILYKAGEKETYIDFTIVLNYIFMAIVVIMFGIIIFLADTVSALPDLFFRSLGAAAIIDGTLTILVIIFYRLHLSRYPKQEDPLQNSWGYPDQNVPQKEKKGLSIWVWILIIYLAIQILFGALFGILGIIFW